MLTIGTPKQTTHENDYAVSHPDNERFERILQTECDFVYATEFESLDLTTAAQLPQGVSLYAEEESGNAAGANFGRLQSRPLLTADGERHLFRKMNFYKFRANALRSQLNPGEPNSDRLDEIEALLQDAECARNHIAECNLRLVISIARKFATSTTDFEELVSEAGLILLKAIDKFDYSRGFRFSTYATHSVQRHIFRWCRTKQRRKNLEQPASVEMIQTLPCNESDQLHLNEEQGAEIIAQIEKCLDKRESFIIRERFGIGTDNGSRTFRDIAAELGLSKERVRQIQVKALDKLRECFSGIELEFATH